MDNNNDTFPFSPILIMEFIRQTTVARCLSGESADIAVRFKLANRFREQKSLVEIAGKYEGQYAERYKKFIEIVE